MSPPARWIAGTLLVACLCIAEQSAGQIAVIDAANLSPNTVSAVQNTLTAAQAVILVADSAMNLISIGVSALEEYNAIVDELSGIMRDANALMWDIRTIEAQTRLLFHLDSAPNNSTDLQLRLADIRRVTSEVLLTARRVQTIVSRAQDALHRLVSIWNRIENLIGNKAAQQNINDALVQLNTTAIQQAAVTSAYQQAMLADKQAQPLIEESVQRINGEIYRTLPQPGLR